MTSVKLSCLCLLLSAPSFLGCGGGVAKSSADAGDASADGDLPDPNRYQFESRFQPNTSAVVTSGQVFRHVLIRELDNYLASVTELVESETVGKGEVAASLRFFTEFDSTTSGAALLTLSTTPPLTEKDFNAISSGKDLLSKLAGNDPATDHKEWNTPGNFLGWEADEGQTPSSLVNAWIEQIDTLAQERGVNPQLDPDGQAVAKLTLTEEGHDLRELLRTFLLGSVAYSQAMDDYLDDATAGKGLLASNLQEEGEPYSTLGHQWDEGFGYFGASFDYLAYRAQERAGQGGRSDYQGYHDTNGNAAIDLVGGEYNFGAAVDCGARDLNGGSSYGDVALGAFIDGRKLILSVEGELSPAQLDELRAHRDEVREAWDACAAGTLIHHINAVVSSMDSFSTENYDFAIHAREWSALKGHALSMQFHPQSPLLAQNHFSDLHQAIGMAPVLAFEKEIDIDNYRDDLLAARETIRMLYGFTETQAQNF